MLTVGFEPTSANTVELESTPLDRSGTLAYFYTYKYILYLNRNKIEIKIIHKILILYIYYYKNEKIFNFTYPVI